VSTTKVAIEEYNNKLGIFHFQLEKDAINREILYL
jgi:hypothetical protein